MGSHTENLQGSTVRRLAFTKVRRTSSNQKCHQAMVRRDSALALTTEGDAIDQFTALDTTV